MDPEDELSAADIVNTWEERRLSTLLRDYGEERFARQIARAIVRARGRAELTTTTELVDVIKAAVPAPARFAAGHPAKRTFQAIRIAVNDELGQIDARAARRLEPAARRWPFCRDFLPLARRPPREALPCRQGAWVHLPAGSARVRLRPGPGGRADHAPRRRAHRGRTGRKPPRAVRPHARRTEAGGQHPMSTTAAAHPQLRRRAGSQIPRRKSGPARPAPKPADRHAPRRSSARSRTRCSRRPPPRRRADARPPRARPPVAGHRRGRPAGHRLHAGVAAAPQRERRRRGHKADTLERENSGLRGDISKLDSGERIQDVAAKLGMVMPPAGDVHFLDARGANAARASTSITAPDPVEGSRRRGHDQRRRRPRPRRRRDAGRDRGTAAPRRRSPRPPRTTAPAPVTQQAPATRAARPPPGAHPTGTPAPAATTGAVAARPREPASPWR